MFGGSHEAASVVSPLMGAGIAAALIGCGLLYRNWPTGIRIGEAGVSIGAVGSRRAAARRPTVTHQNWGLFTCAWPSIRYVMVVTDPARIREIKKSPPYWTLSNRWGKPREMTRCMAGVLTAPFMKAALVVGVGYEEAGVVSPDLGPALFFANFIGAPRSAEACVQYRASAGADGQEADEQRDSGDPATRSHGSCQQLEHHRRHGCKRPDLR